MRRWQFWVLALVVGVFAILVAYRRLDRALGNPPVVIGRDTTWITEPLDDHGLPDYVAYLDSERRRDFRSLKPDDNAAVLLWQAMWPGELEEQHRAPLCQALGMPVPDPTKSLNWDEPRLREELSTWIAGEYGSDDGSDAVDELLRDAAFHPWRSAQIAPLAQWIQSHEHALDLLVAGAARPYYYSPSPESLINADDVSLLDMSLPDCMAARAAAYHLSRRAMWHIAEERPMQAWRDLKAVYQLANHLLHNGVMLVEQLVGIALDTIASNGTAVLMHHGGLTEQQAQTVYSELMALPNESGMQRAIDVGERVCFLDTASRMATGRVTLDGIASGASRQVPLGKVDWNPTFRLGNIWYDRMVRFAKLPIDERRNQADQLDLELFQITQFTTSMKIGAFVSRRVRSELIARILIALWIPGTDAVMDAVDRRAVWRQISTTSVALAVFRARNGEYPASLDELVPDMLPSLPIDIYSGEPLIYEKRGDGYLLFSVGENGVSDGGDDASEPIVDGEWLDEDPADPTPREASDIVLRLPARPFPNLQRSEVAE